MREAERDSERGEGPPFISRRGGSVLLYGERLSRTPDASHPTLSHERG
jgi:hypothetical protein